MSVRSSAYRLLDQEVRGLAARLDRVKPFALQETMVPAAAPSLAAQTAVERYLATGRQDLRRMVTDYQDWLSSPDAQRVSVAEAQRRLAFLRLRFNAVLSQLDIFADAMTQRSEQETGIWLAGLDVVAEDMLRLPGGYYRPPPVICYLDRGHGAAIRRARTRLPGGGGSPVAIVRMPRERMISGSGIASSLAHEVGHQGTALLDLIGSLRPQLRAMQPRGGIQGGIWQVYERWLSEILADFWAVARVGVASTLGLMGVVSLPRAFVFRVNLDDPHPIPWFRVKLSCAMGDALYPDPQWRRLAAIWEAYYPLAGLDSGRRQLLTTLEAALPQFVGLLVHHKPAALRGAPLAEAVAMRGRRPDALRARFQSWRADPQDMRRAPPSLAFAVVSQARADSKLSPEAESNVLARLLTHWALAGTLNAYAACLAPGRAGGIALAT
ncbi:MAG: hypothetical protein HYX92_02190 [Chloroflexi bacterium]|nr:hypothetical protein [Chloroflexota bacterium]